MTQNEQILHLLKCGRRLTPIAALKLVGTLRLASRIHELRAQGHPIMADSIAVNGKRFRVYWLP